MSKVSINETTLTAIGDAIRAKTGKSGLIAPGSMPDEIASITGGGGGDIEVEPIVLTGDCQYGCSGGMSGTYIKLFGNTVSTNNITRASNMFFKCGTETIPFELNFNTSSRINVEQMFYGSNLRELPKINQPFKVDYTCRYLFADSKYLREIPKEYGELDWSYGQTYQYANYSYPFYDCRSLRSIHPLFLNNYNCGATSTYSTQYNYMFNYCFVLDEAVGVAVTPVTFTSNAFSYTLSNCYRLKRFAFMTNDDGTAKTANWRVQLIDFSPQVGYGVSTGKNNITTNYNSGITADKEVKDDATYQALKNDPDWFTCDIAYSRYNHDSAVETINSLPDTSAYLAANGGTNTVKFKGASGSATDGGAINTLTEEEIAVATAKGWTVTLA